MMWSCAVERNAGKPRPVGGREIAESGLGGPGRSLISPRDATDMSLKIGASGLSRQGLRVRDWHAAADGAVNGRDDRIGSPIRFRVTVTTGSLDGVKRLDDPMGRRPGTVSLIAQERRMRT